MKNKNQLLIYILVALGTVAVLVAVGVVARGRAQISAVTSVIDAEAEAVKAANLTKIMAVYDSSATVIEGDKLGLRRQWSGTAQIFKKYRYLLRTQKFSRFKHTPLDVRITNGLAVVVSDVDGEFIWWQGPTDTIHSERSEIWTLVRRGDQWKILRYVYGRRVPAAN